MSDAVGAPTLESYELVMLLRPHDPAQYEEAELVRIQREHLDYHLRLRDAGLVVTNGPVLDQPDERLRGLTFYRTGSTERARELAEADPAVIARRLEVEVMTWLCPTATMARPGTPFAR